MLVETTLVASEINVRDFMRIDRFSRPWDKIDKVALSLKLFLKLQVACDSSKSPLLVLKFQTCLLPHCTVNSGNVALVAHMFLNRFQTPVCHLYSLHLRATRLCHRHSVARIFSCKVDVKQWLVSLVVVAFSHAIGVRSVRSREHGLNELVQVV